MTENKYLLLDRVAVGGMAEIYRAKSLGVEGFERIVIIKRILPQLAEDSEFVAMFVNEAKIAVQLNHAGIVPIYELGKIDDTHFIAMEYVWGKDLRELLKRFKKLGQPMPPPMAAWITAKILEALDYAHRKRDAEGRPLAIIHRDISPQNVLVSYDGLVKLIDFGIAKAAGRATQTQAGVIKGKLAYMSPEQIMGRQIDHRSDIFAASSLAHELITGKQAFGGTSDIDIIDKVREARAPLLSEIAPHVPQQLSAVIARGLTRDPNERYQTAGEMHEALMMFIASMKPPYGTSALSRWMRGEFAKEMEAERAHIDRLTNVEAPGMPVAQAGARKAPTASRDDEFVELSQLVAVDDIDFDALESAEDAPEPAFAEIVESGVLDDAQPVYSAPPMDYQQQYAQPEQQYAQQQYAQPGQQYAQPQYQPPPAGDYSDEQTYVSAPYSDEQTYVQPQGAYAGEQAAYAQQQAEYAQQQAAYEQQHAAYAQAAYAEQQAAYAQQRAAYEQQHGAYNQAQYGQQGAGHPQAPADNAPTQLQKTTAFSAFDPQAYAAAYTPTPQAAPGGFAPPRLGADAVAPRPSSRPAAPPKKKSRLGCVLVLLFLMLLAGGGAAVWIFVFGGRAIVEQGISQVRGEMEN